MALSDAIQGARKTPQRITWTYRNGGGAVDLTDATISGRIKPNSGQERAVDGTLTLVDPTSGIFDWTYGAEDVGDYGEFQVQFTATYPSALKEISIVEEWTVHKAV